MNQITLNERNSLLTNGPYLSDATLARKIIAGINAKCAQIGISPISNIISTYSGLRFSMNARKNSRKFCCGQSYPSSKEGLSRLRLPNLPRFYWQDMDNILPGVGVSGVVGFTVGIVGLGIAAAKRAQQKRQNRIQIFTSVYNALMQ